MQTAIPPTVMVINDDALQLRLTASTATGSTAPSAGSKKPPPICSDWRI